MMKDEAGDFSNMENEPAKFTCVSSLTQRRRQSAILAATRRVLAEQGFTNFRMQDVAETCGVSIRTLYNLFGKRQHLVSRAVVDFMFSSSAVSNRLADYPNPLLALSDVFWHVCTQKPDFMRNSSLSYVDCSEYRSILRRKGVQIYANALFNTRIRSELRGDINPVIVAERLLCLTGATVLDWANGLRTIEQLRADLLEGNLLIFRGAFNAPTARRIQEWMSSFKMSERRLENFGERLAG